MDESTILWQWALVIISSILLFWVSPYAKSTKAFFKGGTLKQEPHFWILTSSLVISWIFAKSITNAANLGMSYGFVGGVSYAAYYLSFLVAGILIYFMRTKGKITSIHTFLQTKFGKGSIQLFSLLIAFRLMNEVWSNTMVIGSYFGEAQTASYYIAILVFTLLTLAYTLKGGLKSSLFTDAIQMILFAVLLAIILYKIIPNNTSNPIEYISTGSWTQLGGINLLFVALLQVFSYPFHDPVMTDRAFIAAPKKTLYAFIVATIIGTAAIILFSMLGIYAGANGLSGQAPVEVGKLLGIGMMILINFIMITSAASTLDSSFNSFSKLIVVDLQMLGVASISKGRMVIIIGCLLGSIPILLNADILSATTISGTMVIGLTPIFCLWYYDAPKASFYLSVVAGIIIGIFHLLKYEFPLFVFQGPYHDLLSANIWGILICFTLYLIPMAYSKILKV